jgi:hypothetical protein
MDTLHQHVSEVRAIKMMQCDTFRYPNHPDHHVGGRAIAS